MTAHQKVCQLVSDLKISVCIYWNKKFTKHALHTCNSVTCEHHWYSKYLQVLLKKYITNVIYSM